MKISAFWIVKNEEKNLPRSIESLRGGVDELIVVDTGSTDRTVEIAKEYGARVEYFEWIKDFSAARNYALSFITGDIILWMDADEWFVPAFGPAEKAQVEARFAYPDVDVVTLRRTDIDEETGLSKGFIDLWRFFRRARGFHFEGKIHEVMMADDGRMAITAPVPLNLNHSGYSETVMQDKLNRNIELLEKEVADEGQAPAERAKFRVYLMREYNTRGEKQKAFEQLLPALRDAQTPKVMAVYPVLAAQYAVLGMDLGRAFRGKVSRRELYDGLVRDMQKAVLPEQGYVVLPLLYRVSFENRMDRLLAEVEKKIAPGKAHSEKWINDMLVGGLSTVYGHVADMYWKLGRADRAYDYALAALQERPDKKQMRALRILLYCMAGQPEADQILLLRSVLDTENQMKMEWLVSGLRDMGGTLLYFYFFKQQFEKGWANKRDYFYVQLLQGKQQEMLTALTDRQNKVAPEMVRELLPLAAISGGDKSVLEKYGEEMGPYKRMVESYFAGEALAEPGGKEILWLLDHHGILTRISPEAAEKFRMLFKNRPDVTFHCKVRWCIDQGVFGALREEDLTGAAGAAVGLQNDLLYCMLLSGRYEAALARIEQMLREGNADGETFNSLLVVAQCAGGDAAARAGALHDAEWPLWNEYVDLQDVVNTGVVFDDFLKKGERRLGALTAAQWKKSMAEQPKTGCEKYLKAWKKAADAYADKGYLGMAQQCLCRMLANGYRVEDTKAALAAVYEKLGNPAVAEAVKSY